MKRKAKKEWGDTIPAVLYRDDLEALFGLFGEVCERVKMELGGFELDSPDDLAAVDVPEARDLSVIGTVADGGPSAVLVGSRYGFYVYLSDGSDLRLLGLREAIERLLKSRTVRPALGMSPSALFWSGTIVAIVGGISGFPYRAAAIALALGLMAAGLVVVVTRAWAFLRRAGVVYLRPSSTAVAGIRISRDVALVLLGAVASAVVALLLGVLAYWVGLRTP
jgi:hypothetical protein